MEHNGSCDLCSVREEARRRRRRCTLSSRLSPLCTGGAYSRQVHVLSLGVLYRVFLRAAPTPDSNSASRGCGSGGVRPGNGVLGVPRSPPSGRHLAGPAGAPRGGLSSRRESRCASLVFQTVFLCELMVARVTEASGSLAPTQRPGLGERWEQMLAASWGAGLTARSRAGRQPERTVCPAALGAREQVQGSLALSPPFFFFFLS